MKTSDGRFIEKRIKIPKELIKQIIYKIKQDCSLTWNDLSDRLGISLQLIRIDWIKKGNTIPKSIFERLIDLDRDFKLDLIKDNIEILNPFWGQEKGGKCSNQSINESIKLPNRETDNFTEFYGIMIGDGCIYSNFNGFCISGDSILDKSYYELHLKELIKNLFCIEPKIYYSKQSNSIRCVLYSKKITNFLQECGFPIGKKKQNKLVIPIFISKDNKLSAACLRGIMDTDGSVCAHPNSKIMIQISMTIPSLLLSCKEAFNRLGLDAGLYNKGINLYGIDKVKRYFSLIGSSNLKHLLKYNFFLKEGKLPSKQEIESFLRKENM